MAYYGSEKQFVCLENNLNPNNNSGDITNENVDIKTYIIFQENIPYEILSLERVCTDN